MMDEFLKQYILDLIEASDDKYNITDEELTEIIDNIRYNERVWNLLDYVVFEQIEDYRVENNDEECDE